MALSLSYKQHQVILDIPDPKNSAFTSPATTFLFPSPGPISIGSRDSLPSPHTSDTFLVHSLLAATLPHCCHADRFLVVSPSLPSVAHHRRFLNKYVKRMLVPANITFFTLLQPLYN